MSAVDVRAAIVKMIGDIAPEADLTAIPPSADLREALDIDSMDFLNLVIAVHAALGVDIPERDYPQVMSLDGMVAYVRAHQPA
ncbi:acyl carrier protein [Nannocystis pusilla]|uniref:acyl carrier protein n=1 Tax=Nannocystis pusilla TaxID=889268 RepID=UPI003BF439A6